MAAVQIIDDDRLKVRALQGAATAAPLFPATKPSTAPLSTIAPAKLGEVPRHHPVLPLPNRNMMLDVLASHQETERLTHKSANLFDADVTKSFERIKKLDAEKQEALENEAKSAKSRATWSTLGTIAQYISNAGLIAVGASSTGLAAPLLIAAGVIGIGNRTLHDAHLTQAAVSWCTESKALQKKITENLETSLLFLEMGLGLAGGAAAWRSGALAGAQLNGNTIKSILTGASGVVSTTSQIGQGYYDKQIADLRAQLKEIETYSTTENFDIHSQTKEVGKMIDAIQAETDELRKAIQALQISLD